MTKLAIFLFFWVLTTFSISQADLFGIILSIAGFLFLFTMTEDLENNG